MTEYNIESIENEYDKITLKIATNLQYMLSIIILLARDLVIRDKEGCQYHFIYL